MDSDNSKSKNKKEEIDISKEVNDLPIGALISGPLKAVVDAQKNMAEFTSKFIKEVGQDRQKMIGNGKSYRK
ncbi:MAG: DUF2589 domain-containing protein [Odoribacter sp.]|nr:DUF2589 domain-containing protein [Odoribacter sp.]